MPTLGDLITDPIAILPRHTLQYRILNNYRADPVRTVEVYASVEEIAFFREQGYLVRESLFTHAHPALRRLASVAFIWNAACKRPAAHTLRQRQRRDARNAWPA